LAGPDQGEEKDLIVFPLAKGNTLTMEDLLRFSSEVLGYPILFNKEEMNGVTCSFTSQVAVSRSEFQGFFERLLLNKCFVYSVSGSGSSQVHRVSHIQSAHRLGGIEVSMSVPLGQLDQYANRGIVLSTVIPLKNVTCRDMISSLTPFMNQSSVSGEAIRPVENANALLVTGIASKVSRIAAICAEIDQVAGAEGSGFVKAVSEMKTSLTAMKKKIAELEGRLARIESK